MNPKVCFQSGTKNTRIGIFNNAFIILNQVSPSILFVEKTVTNKAIIGAKRADKREIVRIEYIDNV